MDANIPLHRKGRLGRKYAPAFSWDPWILALSQVHKGMVANGRINISLSRKFRQARAALLSPTAYLPAPAPVYPATPLLLAAHPIPQYFPILSALCCYRFR